MILQQVALPFYGTLLTAIVVPKREDLPYIDPPAIAYVLEDGTYYLKYNDSPYFLNTAYYQDFHGWHSLDVAVPHFDRPIYITNTRWVIVNGERQDLDLYVNAFAAKGLSQSMIEVMAASAPVPETNITDLNTLAPGDLVFRVGRTNMSDPESELDADHNSLYIASVECMTHPGGHLRKCWNLTCIAGDNPALRLQRVIHTVESENTVTELIARQKLVPGDILYDKLLKTWNYIVQWNTTLIQLEFAREFTVLNKAEYTFFKKYCTFTHQFVINLTHETQSWTRYLPTAVQVDGTLSQKAWSRKQHPADFCYVS